MLDPRIFKLSRIEVVFWSLMVGAGEVYIGAYSIACGFSDRYSGLVTALPLGIASILQLFTGRFRQYFDGRKNFVIFCAVGQAITLFLITGHDLFDRGSPVLLILVLTLYWMFGLTAGPAWNAWIVSIIPKAERPLFFAKRGPFHELSVLFALVSSGLCLYFAEDKLLVFAFIFVVAGLSRLASAFSLSKIPAENKSISVDPAEALDLPSLKDWLRLKKVRWMLILLGSFNFGVYISSPFFTPFMLRQMNMDYFVYMALIAVPFVVRALAYRVFEKLIKKVGIFLVLLPCLITIAIVPALWANFPLVGWIIVFQIMSGLAWSGFEYSILVKQLSEFPPNERSRVLTWTNFIVGFCNISGVIIGSELLGSKPQMQDYFNLFEISAMVRALCVLVVFAIDWRVSKAYITKIYMRSLGLRGNRGGVDRPILYVDDK